MGTQLVFFLDENKKNQMSFRFQVGDKARFVIPSYLGYGSSGAGGAIPPDATLVFDVELMDVK